MSRFLLLVLTPLMYYLFATMEITMKKPKQILSTVWKPGPLDYKTMLLTTIAYVRYELKLFAVTDILWGESRFSYQSDRIVQHVYLV